MAFTVFVLLVDVRITELQDGWVQQPFFPIHRCVTILVV